MTLIVALATIIGALIGAFINHALTARRENRKWARDQEQERVKWERERDRDDVRWERERAERQEQWRREDQARWHKERLGAYSTLFTATDEWLNLAHSAGPKEDRWEERYILADPERAALYATSAKIGHAISAIELFAPPKLRVNAWAMRAESLHYLNELIDAERNRKTHRETLRVIFPIFSLIENWNSEARAMIRVELGIDSIESGEQPSGSTASGSVVAQSAD